MPDDTELHRAFGRMEGKIEAIHAAMERAHTARAEQTMQINALHKRVDTLETDWYGAQAKARGIVIGVGVVGSVVGSIITFLALQWQRLVDLFVK